MPTVVKVIDRRRPAALSDRCPMFLASRAFPAGFMTPCLPTNSPEPPSGPMWLHEIKHDGFRVVARKEGKQVKLYSRPGSAGGLGNF